MKYSQNNEQEHILEYFKDNYGISVLDIGANDGKTFSNSLALIERGARAVLVEPSPTAFEKLMATHRGKPHQVQCVRAAIGSGSGVVDLHESGPHLPDSSDVALLSSVVPEETTRWKEAKRPVEFNTIQVNMITYAQLQQLAYCYHFDFITIDAEGLDVQILRQINLAGTRMVCVEHNGDQEAMKSIEKYCSSFGLNRVIYCSGENLIMAR